MDNIRIIQRQVVITREGDRATVTGLHNIQRYELALLPKHIQDLILQLSHLEIVHVKILPPEPSFVQKLLFWLTMAWVIPFGFMGLVVLVNLALPKPSLFFTLLFFPLLGFVIIYLRYIITKDQNSRTLIKCCFALILDLLVDTLWLLVILIFIFVTEPKLFIWTLLCLLALIISSFIICENLWDHLIVRSLQLIDLSGDILFDWIVDAIKIYINILLNSIQAINDLIVIGADPNIIGSYVLWTLFLLVTPFLNPVWWAAGAIFLLPLLLSPNNMAGILLLLNLGQQLLVVYLMIGLILSIAWAPLFFSILKKWDRNMSKLE